jgi:hypothetical protein
MVRELDDELTKFELLVLDHRVTEINNLLDLDLDDDICDNLIEELEEIEVKLLRSIRAIKIKESGLRIA